MRTQTMFPLCPHPESCLLHCARTWDQLDRAEKQRSVHIWRYSNRGDCGGRRWMQMDEGDSTSNMETWKLPERIYKWEQLNEKSLFSCWGGCFGRWSGGYSYFGCFSVATCFGLLVGSLHSHCNEYSIFFSCNFLWKEKQKTQKITSVGHDRSYTLRVYAYRQTYITLWNDMGSRDPSKWSRMMTLICTTLYPNTLLFIFRIYPKSVINASTDKDWLISSWACPNLMYKKKGVKNK